VAEWQTHLFGEDYLLEQEGPDSWKASVPCFCGIGGPPSGPTDWHWHDVAWTDDLDGLVVLLSVRSIIDQAAEAA
jgi:hypothetical protein